MNERIKALAGEAAKYVATAALPLGEAGDDLFVEKFAELIIQDCIKCCVLVAHAANIARDTARDDEFDYFYGREDAAALCKSTIKKHFAIDAAREGK